MKHEVIDVNVKKLSTYRRAMRKTRENLNLPMRIENKKLLEKKRSI